MVIQHSSYVINDGTVPRTGVRKFLRAANSNERRVHLDYPVQAATTPSSCLTSDLCIPVAVMAVSFTSITLVLLALAPVATRAIEYMVSSGFGG
ncbi:hypothetical protein FHT93_003769 [Rhizobium sp. BK379]|nr:hypothetical protein [Rhizobium sp. BK379]